MLALLVVQAVVERLLLEGISAHVEGGFGCLLVKIGAKLKSRGFLGMSEVLGLIPLEGFVLDLGLLVGVGMTGAGVVLIGEIDGGVEG